MMGVLQTMTTTCGFADDVKLAQEWATRRARILNVTAAWQLGFDWHRGVHSE